MPLPDLIEIVPLDKPVHAEITVPGSKSITNRGLILAALADGQTTLQEALWSEDTQVMVEALQKLGFDLRVELDTEEFCNRTITVMGLGGRIPNAGTAEKPVELFVGNAGTAARFLAALVCLGHGAYRLHGVARMHERPQAALFSALRELGYRIDSPNDKLPAVIHGSGPRAGKCRVSIEESSQFASALILCSIKGRWSIQIFGENAEESPYVKMTDYLLVSFQQGGGTMHIEPDASSGSYFWAISGLIGELHRPEMLQWARKQSETDGAALVCGDPVFRVRNWPSSGWQIDDRFPSYIGGGALLMRLSAANGTVSFEAPPNQPSLKISRLRDLGDSIMTAVVMAPFWKQPTKFTDLGRLRLQECERVAALRTELTKCGAKVIEDDDTLEVFPSQLHGAEIETYNDHRMAMCFAILGLKVPGIKIKNPSCVKKTFPNFFQKLAGPPPRGLGAAILDGRTGRRLGMDELFVE